MENNVRSIGYVTQFVSWLGVCAALGCGGDDGSSAGATSTCGAQAQVMCACPGSAATGLATCSPAGVIGVCTGCPNATSSSAGATSAVNPPGTGTAGATTSVPAAMSGAAPAPNVAGAGAPAPAGSGAAGSAAAIGGNGAAPAMTAGSRAPSAGVGAAGTSAPAAAGSPAAAMGCAAGEMCKMAPLGGVKFCSSDPAAALPPACPAMGQACGANGKGLCIDAAAVGFAGMLFCIYTAC